MYMENIVLHDFSFDPPTQSSLQLLYGVYDLQ